MTVAELSFDASRPEAPRVMLWVGAAGLAWVAHAGIAYLALQHPPVLLEDAAPPAITIDLAPLPAAPEERIAPDAVTAPEVDMSMPEPLAEAPAPPPPVEEAEQPIEAPELAPPPDLKTPMPTEAPPVLDALPDLSAPEVAAPRPVPRPQVERKVEAPKPEPVERRPPAPSKPAVQAQARAQVAEKPVAAQSSQGMSQGASPAKWQARLMAHLERRKRYPAGARARKEEGTASVRFTIDDRGNVRSARLVRSSGYPELDAAVIALVNRASPVPAPPPGAPHEVSVPVRFAIR
jgi:protein TonB